MPFFGSTDRHTPYLSNRELIDVLAMAAIFKVDANLQVRNVTKSERRRRHSEFAAIVGAADPLDYMIDIEQQIASPEPSLRIR